MRRFVEDRDVARTTEEARGWAATTVAAVAAEAAVSPKTVQALFGTKAALLAAAVDYAFAGDVAAVPITARESARVVESAPDAASWSPAYGSSDRQPPVRRPLGRHDRAQ